jgi:hypothetical protein
MTKKPKKTKAEEEKNKADKPAKRQHATRPKKGKPFILHEHIAALQRQMGTHFSAENKGPGDVAWKGPCENGKQMVCKFNDSMMPSDCGPENCS